MSARTTILVVVVACFGCGHDDDPPGETPSAEHRYSDDDLRGIMSILGTFELPVIPDNNPLTPEKVRLGRHLFYERRLSANETQACVDCHVQSLAFSDGKIHPVGSTGTPLKRNSQGLANVAYVASLTWASNNLLTIEEQLHVPLSNDNPVELGITDGKRAEVLSRFDADPNYAAMFDAAFPGSAVGVTLEKVIFALASFCRTITSASAPYDTYLAGDDTALTAQQKEGAALFFGERFECFHCHSGATFSVAYRDARSPDADLNFFNNGLYNLGGDGSYPASDQGLFDLTSNPSHRGLFRPPSLRNVALTAPFMHDGSIATLREVVQHYVAGGRNITSGPNAGDGRLSPLKSGLVRPFAATDAEIDAVVAFLESLSDPNLLTNDALSAPLD